MEGNGETKKFLDANGIEEVIQGEVKAFGTSAHVVVQRKHLGKQIMILVKYPEKKK